MTFNEFIQKFESIYKNDFEYEWDEDSQQVFFSFSIPLDLQLESIKLDFLGDSYNLYKEFLYGEYDNALLILERQKEECLFDESIKRTTGQAATICYEDGMGCPFCSDLVGYFNVPFSWEDLACKLDWIVGSSKHLEEIDIGEVDQESELFLSYKKAQSELYEKLRQYSPRLCTTKVENSPLNSNKNLENVCAYIDDNKTIITGVGLEFLPFFCSTPEKNKCSQYLGMRFVILSLDGADLKRIVIRKVLFDEVIALIEQLDTEEIWDIDNLITCTITSDGKFLMSCGELWSIICPIKQEYHEECLIYEKNKIKSLQRDFIKVASKKIWNQVYDFSRLDDERFEKMCSDLLYALKFQNISIRGKSRAPDGGVDITAEEEYTTLVGTEKRKWIFQCKHMKAQIGRKDLSEVRDLLREFSADCYGLFHSGDLTPSTLDRIENICKSDGIKIKYWDRNRIEAQLEIFPQISIKYFGL